MSMLNKSISVLLVEDDEVDIKNIQYGFKEFNIQNTLIITRNGVEALDKLYGRNGVEPLTHKPKVILLDINMPKMSGFEFLKRLRADSNFSTIPVLVITTSDSEFEKKRAQTFNVEGYFLKPLNFKKFFPFYQHIIEDDLTHWKEPK